MRRRGVTLVELAVAMMIAAVIAAGVGSLLARSARVSSREAAMTESTLLAEEALARAARWVRAACDAHVDGAEPQQALTLAMPQSGEGEVSCPEPTPFDPARDARIYLLDGQPVISLPGRSPVPLAAGLRASGLSASVLRDAGGRVTVTLTLTVGGRSYGTTVMPRMGG